MTSLILLLLMATGARSQTPDREDFIETLQTKHSEQGNSCKDIVTDFGVVRVYGPKAGVKLPPLYARLFKGGKQLTSVPLPSFGGDSQEPGFADHSQKCLDVQYFAQQKILIYRVFKGMSSPAAIETTVLVAIKVGANSLSYIDTKTILAVDDEADVVELKSYTTHVRGDTVVLAMKDELENNGVVIDYLLK